MAGDGSCSSLVGPGEDSKARIGTRSGDGTMRRAAEGAEEGKEAKRRCWEGENTRRVAAQRWEEWRYGAARSTRSLAIARRNFWKLPEWRGDEAEPSSRRRGVARMGGVEQWSRGEGQEAEARRGVVDRVYGLWGRERRRWGGGG